MQSNSDFIIDKYEDAVDQFDSLTDRLTLSVTDRPLVNCDFCRGIFSLSWQLRTVNGGIFLAWPLRVSLSLNNGIITIQVYFDNDFE